MSSTVLTVFSEAFKFMHVKAEHHTGHADRVAITAEGLISGSVVAQHTVRPAKRPGRLAVSLDTAGLAPVGDGSSVVTAIAAVVDKDSVVKRLAEGAVQFEVDGPTSIISRADADPRSLIWGQAPVLLRLHRSQGQVRITAHFVPGGVHQPRSGSMEFDTFPPTDTALGDNALQDRAGCGERNEIAGNRYEYIAELEVRFRRAEKKLGRLRSHETEIWQTEFEETPNS